MLTLNIKTWACGACGYKQDFEPTAENAKKHFNDDQRYSVNDLKENECPSCRLGGANIIMAKAVGDDRISMRVFEKQADIDLVRAEMEAKPKQKIQVGKAKRAETEQEKAERIDKELISLPKSITVEKVADIRSAYEAITEEKEEAIYREETDEEQTKRIEKSLSSLKVATPEEIASLRVKHEDK
jgi:ribosomal protein S27AE